VDLAAPHVVGGYLLDRPRDVLYDLARSANVWERRTAIVATLYLIRHGEPDDAVRIAALLLDDHHDLIHKAVGWALREVGRTDRGRLLAFLDEHAARMPRTMLRTAMEHLDQQTREHYPSLGREVRR
jgi:3-methyladenine DNA glycosylase AlkD